MSVGLKKMKLGDRNIVEPLFDQYSKELLSLRVRDNHSNTFKPTDYSLLDEYWRNEKNTPYLISFRGELKCLGRTSVTY